GLARGLIADVADEGPGLAARLRDELYRLVRGAVRDVGDDDRRTLGRDHLGGRAADARARSGHDDDLAGQVERSHGSPLLVGARGGCPAGDVASHATDRPGAAAMVEGPTDEGKAMPTIAVIGAGPG